MPRHLTGVGMGWFAVGHVGYRTVPVDNTTRTIDVATCKRCGLERRVNVSKGRRIAPLCADCRTIDPTFAD